MRLTPGNKTGPKTPRARPKTPDDDDDDSDRDDDDHAVKDAMALEKQCLHFSRAT